MALYQIQGTLVEETDDKGIITHQIPTFFLDSNIQGITSIAHAVKIAGWVVNPTQRPNLVPHLFATKSGERPWRLLSKETLRLIS